MLRRMLLAGVVVFGTSGMESAKPADNQVTIDNFTFTPQQLVVAVGAKVTWTNRDDIPHTVVSREDPRAMRSPALDTDESFSFTFATPGTYGFFCSLHPHMQGTVVVR